MNKILLSLFLIYPLFGLSQNSINFIGERIDFEITKSLFSSNGIYSFANYSTNEISQTLFFPFAKNADSVQVRRVYNLTCNQKVDYQPSGNGIFFQIEIDPDDTVSINISYSQKTVRENIYVLSSTQSWNKPLQTAKYSLAFDNSVVVDSFSFVPDRYDGSIYYWDKVDFFPEKDFKIFIR